MDCVKTWENCLGVISKGVSKDDYERWFAPIKPVNLSDNTITIGVPSTNFVDVLEDEKRGFFNPLKSALVQVIGPNVRLEYQLYSAAPMIDRRPTVSAPSGGYRPNTAMPKSDGQFNPFAAVAINCTVDPHLNQNYTFDNFVEGESNKLARSVAYSVAEKPGATAFNPLFIYGESGVGKTHLIQAIAAETKRVKPDRKVVYLSAAKFMQQFMKASKDNSQIGFMNFYQDIDVLVIDDIQDLAGKSGTENAFFQIFNHMQQNNKQIVIAADKRPSDIVGIEDRLISRFKAGLIAEMQKPDYDLRVEIIKNKIQKDDIQFPDDVVEYIANNIDRARELDGAIASLLAHATVLRSEITMDLVLKVVSNYANNKEVVSTKVTPDRVIEVVCEHYNIDPTLLQKNTRKHEVVSARQLAMYLCREMTQMSLSSIGTKIGNRNHATVLYACQTVANQIDVNKAYANEVKQIEMKIKG